MEEKKARDLFERYKLLMTPVQDSTGKVIGASFPYEEGVVVKCKSSMSNVRQHLANTYYGMLTPDDKKRWNPRKKRKVEEDSMQPTIESAVGKALSREECAEIFARGCAMGALPLSLAQNRGIRYISRKLNPRCAIVSRTSVTRHVDKLFGGVTERIGAKIRALRQSDYGLVNVAICLDMWTSSSVNAHLGMNAFVLDSDFNLHRYALACVPFAHPHTSVRIAEESAKMLGRWGLAPEELIAVTTDNEASALSAARKLAGTEEGEAVKRALLLKSIAVSLPCSCHTMNLCGTAASETTAFKKAFEYVTDMVSFFGPPHTKRQEALEKKRNELQLKKLRFIKAAPTRWNYVSDVIGRADGLTSAVAVLSVEDLDIKEKKEQDEWKPLQSDFMAAIASLKTVRPLLQSVNRTIQMLSSGSRMTISNVFPCALQIYNESNALMSSDSVLAREFATSLRDQVNERFYLAKTARLYECAEYLDPTTCKRRIQEDSVEEMKRMREDLAAIFFQISPAIATTSSGNEWRPPPCNSRQSLPNTSQKRRQVTRLQIVWNGGDRTRR